MMDYRLHKEPFVLTSLVVCEEVRERFVEGMNRFFWAIWDKEERMEGAEGGRDAGQS